MRPVTAGRHRFRAWVRYSAVMLAFWAAACSQPDSPDGQRQDRPAAVAVAPVVQKALEETVAAIGSLAASAQITIRPEISAIVRSVHFNEGEAVARGQRLFSLERDEIEQRLRARRAALASARAETEKSRRIFERRKQLLAEKVVTPEAFDEAQADFKTAAAHQDRLTAEIAQIEAELEDTTIRSPIDGVAGALHVDPGDFVDVGQPLVTIVGTDDLEIDFSVPERYANQVAPGQTVRIRTAANPQAPFTGTVFFVSPAIRQATRDRLLKARLDDPAGRLQPGGFANVELIVNVHEDSLVVPEEALVPTRTGYMVFVVEDQLAHRRDVSIGLRRPGEVEIRQGLAPGDTVIRSGQMAVADGDRIRIVDGAGS